VIYEILVVDIMLKPYAVFLYLATFADTSYPSGVIRRCMAKGAIPKGKSTYFPKIVVLSETFLMSLSTLG
jgi:hypothetical protein